MPSPITNQTEFLRNLHVLLVDDIYAVRKVLARILRSLGVEGHIDEAGNGLEAWEMIQARNYDVVICDMRMPQMNGLELLKLLRATPQFVELPFLMISGEVSNDILAQMVENEWERYLLKPFTTAKLEKRLLQLLGRTNNTHS